MWLTGCPDCDQSTAGRCWRHSTRYFTIGPDGKTIETEPPRLEAQPWMGWKCPGCGACYSPLTMACFYCGPQVITVAGSNS